MTREIFARHLPVWTMAFLFVLFFGAALSANAATLYGVKSANQLVSFNSSTPGTVNTIGTITGLHSGEDVVGIDFRPATGQLFALGSTSRLYTINALTGAAGAGRRGRRIYVERHGFRVRFQPDG